MALKSPKMTIMYVYTAPLADKLQTTNVSQEEEEEEEQQQQRQQQQLLNS